MKNFLFTRTIPIAIILKLTIQN